jgi:plasmid stabilization system protein ParE
LRILDNFLDLYQAKINVIAEHPSRYPIIHQASELRKAVLTKHNIILYREKDAHIEIISIFDTRQNPDKITGFVKKM